ncbi:unnamed protein product [Urochloa decumbens]|uniref:Uncharacterized protein n=1 Tax=Urochloa decumbens TaxID=240449 RepID=A0ABC9AP44_9POAL
MARSSRRCSDEELEKALADLNEYLARNPIPDEFMYLCPEQEEYLKKKEKEKDKKKKKKLYRLLPEEVRMILSSEGHKEPRDFSELEGKEEYKDLRTVVAVSDVLLRRMDDKIRAGQEKIRHELLTKGYVTCEITDDEDEEEAMVPAALQGTRGGGGRRRHRPGVTKSAGGVVKKLNCANDALSPASGG